MGILRPNPERLWIRYAIAVGALAVFLTIHFISMQRAAVLSDVYAAIINQSGKQRMLSQRIALFSEGKTKPEAGKDIYLGLGSALAEFESSHIDLTTSNIGDTGIPLSPALKELYFGPGAQNSLDFMVRTYIELARQMLRGGENLDETNAKIQTLARGDLLEKLDRAVYLYEEEAIEAISGIRTAAQVGFVLSLLVLALEALLIFLPAHRSIIASLQKLKTANTKLAEMVDRSKEVMQELQTTRDADVTKSDFLAHMSHEFRTPLKAITGFAELIKSVGSKNLPSSKIDEYLDDIHSSGIHLRNMISDVLDISRIEKNQLKIEIESHPVSEVLDEALTITRLGASERDIHLAVEKGHLPFVLCDRHSLTKCLVNIIHNAIKYSPPGSTVTVSVQRDAQKTAIVVDDQGKGFPAEILENIGLPFLRSTDPLIASQEGAGLGLLITKHLMEIQNGALDVVNRSPKGARVTLSLPNQNSDYQTDSTDSHDIQTLH